MKECCMNCDYKDKALNKKPCRNCDYNYSEFVNSNPWWWTEKTK